MIALLFFASAPGWTDAGQLIWLDFDSGSSPASPDHVYTTGERMAIEEGLSEIFAPFGHTFTSTDPAPVMTTKVLFNDGGFGTSTAVDFRNLITTIDLAATDAGFALDSFGEPRTSDNIVQASINLAAHELLHVLGARHHDAYNPIGAGAGGAGTSSTFQSLTTVLGIDGDRIIAPDLYVSPRSAMKLEFAEAGMVLPEGPEPNDTPPTAAPLTLFDFPVPNTLLDTDPLSVLDIVAFAVTIEGEIDGSGDVDYFALDGAAGQVVTIEVMSDVLDHRLDEFNPKLELLSTFASPILEDDSIDGPDPTLIDVLLPADGVYFIEIASEDLLAGGGEYELLVYSMIFVPEPIATWPLAMACFIIVRKRPRACC